MFSKMTPNSEWAIGLRLKIIEDSLGDFTHW